MSSTGAPSPTPDPLAPLAALPGVPEAVASVRTVVDRVYGHRVMRRRSAEVSAEAALRAARGSAALDGADWPLEELRRRSDFGAAGEPRTVGAALRVTAETGQLLDVWRHSPSRVLARLHLLAASGGGDDGGDGPGEAAVGRPRLAGEEVLGADVAAEAGLPLPDAAEVAFRLEQLTALVAGGTSAPGLVVAAVVHGELLALRPFTSFTGPVARAAQRLVLLAGGLDPKAVCPAEVGHAELGRTAYAEALAGYGEGTPEGLTRWITHCGRAVELGARESAAVCEALQRGAA